MPADERVTQACAYLRMLLLRPGDYRAVWEPYACGVGPGEVDVRAVATVLDQAGLDQAGREEPVTGPAPATEAAVLRALEGVALEQDLLDTFARAFRLTTRHAGRLRELLSGSPAVRVISGATLPPPGLYGASGQPPRHETLSLHELHVLGPDGRPAEHETIQVIKSTVDGLDTVPYRFDTDELVVEMIRGGRVGDRPYRINDSLYGVDIVLAQPLARGESLLLQYRSTFFYRSAPPPEFRRGVMRTTRDLTMWVKFHPGRVPARVWEARWDRLDHARILQQHVAELDGELSVHSRFGYVERAVVGFHWEWD